jgi:hypothetical protein
MAPRVFSHSIQNLEINEVVFDRNEYGFNGQRKAQEIWVVEIGWLMPRIEVAGDICLRRTRPTQGCRLDDDYDLINCTNFRKTLLNTKCVFCIFSRNLFLKLIRTDAIINVHRLKKKDS